MRSQRQKEEKEKMTIIPLTRDFKETINARVQRDSAFAAALLMDNLKVLCKTLQVDIKVQTIARA